ncbi:class I SAM-dependent methyltransferase [Candidatus Saccharibacteria bacterium]|nr:class I SAM-dependent methyltransferase [Candidatus Saccharibacteria bacterium]
MRVLEIGPGNCPAITKPGTLLNGEGIEYVGIDVGGDFGSLVSSHRLWRPDMHTIEHGDSADLSKFPDGWFDLAGMRSVFGEYTGIDCPGSLDNTRMGIYELFRVLKPGGRLFVAEENTPEPPATVEQIGHNMLLAGFRHVTAYACEDGLNASWREQRGKFWGLSSTKETHELPWWPRSFLLVGERPDVPLEQFTEKVVDLAANSSGEKPIRKVGNRLQVVERTFYRSATPMYTQNENDSFAYQQDITVVTSVGSMTLRAYRNAVRAGTQATVLPS